jgi:glycosyltransferase involved in cell wall biosynthesis
VLIGVRGDAQRLVEEAGAGLAFAPGDPAALADAVVALAARPPAAREAMGAAGRAFYDARLSLRAGVDAFERSFVRAVDGV